MIKQEFPQVKLLEPKENLGFGRANNLAIKKSNAKYVFLLNTDTILINNAVKILYDFMEQNPDCAACGGNLYDLNMNPVHSYGALNSPKRHLLRLLGLRYFLPKIRLLKNRINPKKLSKL
ncbi:MAG: glycosyltransferase [Ignavibacteriales bacterium]|nr:glycosyltransferase [Ignavibacteriales bacterium]